MALVRALRGKRRQVVPYRQQGQAAEQSKQWVFLGCPGSGKGTYASLLAQLLQIPHISTGDLVRQGVTESQAMREGQLLPDELILGLLSARLKQGAEAGEQGFVLDGFPRTMIQAQMLEEIVKIDMVVNLRMREDLLISKCLGRRICSECNRGFNLTDVDVEDLEHGRRIRMPPVLPPPACVSKMLLRPDDTEEVVRARLRVYRQQSQPVEEFYRSQGKLVELENEGGISETWARLLSLLHLHLPRKFNSMDAGHCNKST